VAACGEMLMRYAYVTKDGNVKGVDDLPAREDGYVRLACVSDTHTHEPRLPIPDVDILIHAGDALLANKDADGKEETIEKLASWIEEKIKEKKCKEAFVIGGNHDKYFEKAGKEAIKKVIPGYLEDEAANSSLLSMWGSPVSRPYKHKGDDLSGDDLGGNGAFQNDLKNRMDKTPAGLDVLITHGAPYGVGDMVNGSHVGCPVLAEKVKAAAPQVHVFGHVHQQNTGRIRKTEDVIYINACSVHEFLPKDKDSKVYQPIIIDVKRRCVTSVTKA